VEAAGSRGARDNPWQTWQIGSWGHIVYDEKRDSLGAHCGIKTHINCRANKVCSRFGIGYLIAFLREPHIRTGDRKLKSQAEHKEIQKDLCSPDGFHSRESARKYVMDRPIAFASLIALEKRFNPSMEEPLKVRQ